MNLVKYLLAMAMLLLISACGSNNSETGSNVITLKGGAGGSAQGGNGGIITSMSFSNTTSMVHGDLKFHAGGSVDTGFAVPAISPALGSSPATISVDTIVKSAASTTPGDYYVENTNNSLWFVGSGGAAVVTGLTVNAGKKLTIPNINGFTLIPGGIVINGTVSSTTDGEPLDLRSGSFLQINAGGKVTTTPPTGTSSGPLNLSSNNGVLINYGTIESNGRIGSGGASSGVTLTAGTLLYNIGTVTAKGDGVGNGGPISFLAKAGSSFSNGTIDSSGGSGATGGGSAGQISISGGESASVVGRVVLGGTVNGNGGDSSGSGNAGNGAVISLTSFSGGILVNAAISANGGAAKTGGNGGNGGSLQMHNKTGTDNAAQHPVSPEGIKVGNSISMNGGQGGAQGGTGGTVAVASDIEDTSLNGFGNVEFFGYQSFILDGGTSTSGSGGKGGDVTCGLTGSFVLDVWFPSGAINNDVNISCRGGENNPGLAAKIAPGGNGGTVTFKNPQKFDFGDPARTVVKNTGAIDISGGAGTTGGNGGGITMMSYGNLTSTGSFAGTGGTGTSQGGQGAAIMLLSSFNASNSGGSNLNGGDGINGAAGGAGGMATILSGNQTITSTISANGGNSRAGVLPATNGGNGGTITLASEFAYTSRGGLSVSRGSGSSSNSAINGTITIDGSVAATALPLSGSI